MLKVWEKTLEQLQNCAGYGTMFHMMEQYPKNIASEITDSDGNEIKRTYSETVNMSYRVCTALQSNECISAGQTVGLIYDTCMDWPVLFWGILMAGNIPLLLNPTSDCELLNSILNEAGAKSYVATNMLGGCGLPFISAESLLCETVDNHIEKWGEYVALCTSGTTGNSRIFLYDGETIAKQIISFNDAKKVNPEMPFTENHPCKLLAFLPFHHVFGLSVVYLLYSVTGKTLVYLPDKSAQTVLKTCQNHEVTHLYCVPMFFNLLASGLKKKLGDRDVRTLPPVVKYLARKKLLGTKVRSMITGGGHIPTETLLILNELGYPLCNGFGMTETGIVCVELSTEKEQRELGSLGYPFGITEWKTDSEQGNPGELLLRGDGLFSASIVDKTVVPRDKSAWFSTGDVVTDKGNGLFMSGRAKDVIIGASGENVYPEELEETFSSLNGVKNYCILGLKNGLYEDIAIVIEPVFDADRNNLIVEIKEKNEKLPVNEKISTVCFSSGPLPISGNMKVKRRFLKSEIEAKRWPCEILGLYTGNCAKVSVASSGEEYESDGEYKEILETVRLRAAEEFGVTIDPESVGEHFVMSLGGNSLQAFGLFTALSEKYSIEIPDREMPYLENCVITAKLIYSKLHSLPSPLGNVADGNESLSDDELAKTERITDFAESKEYRALKQRMNETFSDGCNPYFIPHDSLIRDTSVINGKTLINLGSYNYLGMSGNPETMQVAIDAIKKYGTSASGSRTLAGEKTLYRQLEQTIARWKHTEDAIVCTGGWATNLSFVSCFAKKGDFIVYDKLSHNSLTEGVKLSDADSKAFEHNNLKQLEGILQKIDGKYNKVLIIVEGVYSMDGDIAPIKDFVELKKKYRCFLMVDEAHSGCVIGDHGGGVDDYFHLEPKDIDIKYGTLSKGLGACGGYIAADASVIEYLRYQMNGFVFTAGIAPPLAAEVMKAIEIIERDNSMVTKLHENIAYFVRRAREEGMDIGLAGESAIVPVLIGSDADAARISQKLTDTGVFVPPAMYPAVPMGESRLRFTISATHSFEQLEKAVTLTAKIMREEGLLL